MLEHRLPDGLRIRALPFELLYVADKFLVFPIELADKTVYI